MQVLVLFLLAVPVVPQDGEFGSLPQFTMRSLRLQVPEGSEVRIPCTTDRTYDIPMIIKKEEDDNNREKLLFVGTVKTVREDRYRIEENEVIVSDIVKSDAGPYLCYYQDNTELKLRHFVEVLFPPTIHSISPIQQKVFKGATVTLECTADGNPKPKILWSKVGGKLPSGAPSVHGVSLTLEDVDRHVEGRYICSADNGVGSSVQVEMSVEVEYAPEIITEQEVVRTGEKDTVELVCVVHARPPATVVWKREGTTLKHINSVSDEEAGERHLLLLSSVTMDDLGVYECTANNSIGKTAKDIIVTDKPKTPIFTSNHHSAYENSYTLTWDTESYYPITEYWIRYRPIQDDDSFPGVDDAWTEIKKSALSVETDGAHHSLRHTIMSLSPATDYEAAVQVKNTNHWSKIGRISFSTSGEVISLQTTSSVCEVEAPSVLLLIGWIIVGL